MRTLYSQFKKVFRQTDCLAKQRMLTISIAISISGISNVSAQENLAEEVDLLLNNGYSADAIFLHEVSKGETIYSIVDAASQSDEDREAEFRQLGEHILPGLPRSACGGNSYQPLYEWRSLGYSDLNPISVSEVARLYFEDGEQMVRFNDEYSHGLFSLSELKDLSESGGFWYEILPVRDHPVPDGVFVSIYANEKQIVVDRNLDRIGAAQSNGSESLPVVFHYYREDVIPVSRFEEKVSGKEVIDLYRSEGIRVSQVPNWKSGDFHTLTHVSDLEDVFEIPEQEDIDEELWAKIENDLRTNGFTFPVIALLGVSDVDSSLHNSVERVAVAKSLGIEEIPTVFFYKPSEDVKLNSACRRLVRNDPHPVQLADIYFAPGRPGNPGGPPLPPPPPPPLPPVVPEPPTRSP